MASSELTLRGLASIGRLFFDGAEDRRAVNVRVRRLRHAREELAIVGEVK